MPTNTKDTTQSMPSLDNKAETISEVLDKFDRTKTPDNPDGNPFFPGNISKAEALATIEKLLLEVIGKDFKAIGGNATLSIHERTIMDAKNYLKAEQRTTLKAVLYGEDKK